MVVFNASQANPKLQLRRAATQQSSIKGTRFAFSGIPGCGQGTDANLKPHR